LKEEAIVNNVTARSADGERERCLHAGMDDYLAKPVRAAELFAAINRVVSGEGGVPPVEAVADVPDGVPGEITRQLSHSVRC
jgi:DNA-binding response OmpR family regulator